ncbi:YeeE/YedE family protein [Aliivibrio fischeri]|uniref:YeeE/YedE family protein n=1 Tax=Aliivibrio fischeri TaxID=668 RepID=UPI0012D8A4E4|nr:YeeE/YedE family protein [Aliivibrio fischeri]MUK39158.1 YeeE/YedE family protein [Aliivibrio fischeri]MUL07803.1 YeeE/YedE family protein [Aliivibrio fischeri]
MALFIWRYASWCICYAASFVKWKNCWDKWCINRINDTEKKGYAWRWLFVLGMISGGAAGVYFFGAHVPTEYTISTPLLIIAGLLVGIGTRLGNGCTSGHGICGIGRLSVRSIVATCVFMLVAGITVFIRLHVL